MKFRTGDILVWRSTTFFDMLGENTLCLPGLHAGVILIGDQFEPYSACGVSPSSTYTTFLVDQIFPIEEVVGHVWTRPNGCSLDIIQRQTGPDISPEEAVRVYRRFIRLKKRSYVATTYLAVAAYFRYGGLIPGSGYQQYRYQFCPSTVSYFLDQFGLLQQGADLNNLLPLDFYHLEFYQRECYRRVTVFEKKTHDLAWWLSAPLIKWGWLEPTPWECPKVNEIMGDYDYPRTKAGTKQKHSSRTIHCSNSRDDSRINLKF